MHASDPQLDGIRRAFDAAFKRMCAASNVDELEAELSNCLSQLYRLGELCKRRLSEPVYYDKVTSSDLLRTARAALWARTFDTHDVVVVARLDDAFSDFYTEMFGVLAWKQVTELPKQTDIYQRHIDYQRFLQGRPVLDTLRRAFDALASLL